MSPYIEFKNVFRHFDTLQVLSGLSFKVEPGQVFALLGRNGSGKTTAIKILLGYLQAIHGESHILGKGSTALTPRDRGAIAYISEGHRLYKTMRVAKILAFENGTRPNFDLAWALKASDKCGLSKKQFVGLLSRGQRAQLALIIAIASRPEVMILDDPAMGLDTVMRREFLDATIELLANRGISVLFSSHILADVERIADRVGILKGGRLTVNATLDDLKTRVQKRFLFCDDNEVPGVQGLLRCRQRPGGFDLTLLDFNPSLEAVLCQNGRTLSDPVVPNLEDLFMDLTVDSKTGLLPDLTEAIK